MISSQLVHSTTKSIDLVYKNDTSLGATSSCCKELSYSLCSHAHVQLLEFRSNDSDEMTACLVS